MLLTTWIRLLRQIATESAADPGFRALTGAVVVLIAYGTVFYSLSQGWSVIDSLYFSVCTLTTVGYGDLTPAGDGAKVATVAYQLVGIGLLLLFLSEIARRRMGDRDA